MLWNYIKVGYRSILKHKLFSFINIFGLALSLSFCLLVIVIDNDQHSFDRFHRRGEDIFRVNTAAQRKDGGIERYASTPFPLGKNLETECPAIDKVVRFSRGLGGDAVIGGASLRLRGFFADPTIFDVFGFELERGDQRTALDQPNALVLTADAAEKLFGTEDPMGKAVHMPALTDFVVTGVLKRFPGKTHLEFEALGSTVALPVLEKERKISPVLDNWNNYYSSYVYVRFKPSSRVKDVVPVLGDISKRAYEHLELETRDRGYLFELQALNDITPGPILSNNLGKGMPSPVIQFLLLLSIVGMVAAVFNYTNLTLARSLARAKEVGIRKVTGASRRQVFSQFLCESILTAIFAFVAAQALLQLILIPGFQNLQLMHDVRIDFTIDRNVYFFFAAFTVAVGVVAGAVPAAMISAFRPVQALKDASRARIFSRLTLRQTLIVVQFTLSLVLLIILTTAYKQVTYATGLEYYGFSWQNVININLQGKPSELLVREIAQYPGVVSYSASSHEMGTWSDRSDDIRKSSADEPVAVRDYSVDSRYLENFGLTVVAGSNFSTEAISHNSNLVIVNERFVERFKLGTPQEAIGTSLIMGKEKVVRIAGVVKDFLFKPLTYRIEPLLLFHDPGAWGTLSVKVRDDATASAISHLTKAWKAIDAVRPFSYEFYGETLREAYAAFDDFLSVIGFLSLLAFTVSVLGLLGMATFSVETKIKEVGVRKVLGAGVRDIVVMLSRHYMLLLCISTLIAVPIGMFVSGMLLERFAYRIALGPSVVLPGTIAILVVGAVTVGWQALRAALSNPVEALRYE